jgi:hypothetical protein
MTLDANAAELDRAESEAEHAGDEFEEAILRLKDAVTHASRPEVEAFLRKRIDGIRSEATKVLTEDPLLAWSIVFAAGVLAGAWITSFSRRDSLSDRG